MFHALELVWLVRPWPSHFFSVMFCWGEGLAQLAALYVWVLCLLVPRLNSGRLGVYSCGHVKQYMGTFRFEVPM